MTSERMFPVLWQGDRQLHAALKELSCPREVPWSLLAPYEAQAKYNHGQSLERLASRGGLSPAEMVGVLRGERLQEMLKRTDQEAVPLLLVALAAHKG